MNVKQAPAIGIANVSYNNSYHSHIAPAVTNVTHGFGSNAFQLKRDRNSSGL